MIDRDFELSFSLSASFPPDVSRQRSVSLRDRWGQRSEHGTPKNSSTFVDPPADELKTGFFVAEEVG